MARQTEIIVSLKDRVTPGINSLRDNTKRLDKSFDELNQTISNNLKRQDALRDGQAKLQASIVGTSEELKKAKQAYKELNDEQNRTSLEKTQRQYNEQQESLKEYRREIRETGNELRKMDDEQSKMANRASSGDANILKSLAGAGLGKILGSSIANAGGAYLSSAYGDQVGGEIESALSGVFSGAAMGSVAGAPGAAVGAGIGLISGTINAGAKEFDVKNQSFKEQRNTLVEDAWARSGQMTESGSAIAGQRERIAKGFEGHLGGPEEAADFVEKLAKRDAESPFTFDDMALLSRTYFGYSMDQEQIFRQLDNMGNLGAAQGLGTEDLDIVSKTVAGMTVMPTIKKTDIEKLTTRGVPVLEYIGNAYGLASDEIFENLKEFDPKEIFEIITGGLEKDPRFAGAMAGATDTYLGKVDMVEAEEMNIQVGRGIGFNEERGKGVDLQNEYFDEYGTMLAKDQEYIGQWEASLENTKEKIERDIMVAIHDTTGEATKNIVDEYGAETATQIASLAGQYQLAMAEDNGAELGRILAEAEILAQAEYNASEGFQQKFEMDKKLINDVTDTLVADKTYWDAGYELGIEMSKGLKEGFNLSKILEVGLGTTGLGTYLFKSSKEDSKEDSSNAFGLDYVPYDGFQIKAHQGERLSTANEARAQDNSKSSTNSVVLNVTGNSFSTESQMDQFVKRLVDEVEGAAQGR